MMLVDGRPESLISVRDRGLNYGDGLFETMRLHAGRVCLLQRHLARLRESCARLAMPYPGDEVIETDLARLLRDGQTEGVVRLVLTRGDGGRGYAPPPGATGRRIVALHPAPQRLPPALSVGVCRTRLGRSTALGGLKHLGRLEQVLAAGEVAAAGWDEGLMLDEAGCVVEATRHNLFYTRAGRLSTPPLGGSGVAGVMRGLVLETMATLGMPGGEATLQHDELHQVDELFLCNAVAGVYPVKAVEGRELPVGGSLATLRAGLVEAGVAWLA